MSEKTDNKAETRSKTKTVKVPTSPFKTAFEAEQAFYLAFVRRDIELMKKVWTRRLPASTCLHPNESPVLDYDAIIKSWEQVFAKQKFSKLQIEHKNMASNQGLAVHRVTEHLTFKSDINEQQGTFHAINTFQCVNNEWFMLSHHASPAPVVTKPSGVTVH